jgi:hypothetical protein
MKLSSRSPKDAAARSGVFESYYARAVRDERGKLRELDDEQKLWILCESEGAALRFRDAASVVRALVLSERVWQVLFSFLNMILLVEHLWAFFQDMTLAMRHPETWRQNVILRKWEPVPIDMVGAWFLQSIVAVSIPTTGIPNIRIERTTDRHFAICLPALFSPPERRCSVASRYRCYPRSVQ